MKDIKKLREARGMSKYKLSKLSNISASTIKDIESGKCSPTLYTLTCLAKALNITIEELLSE